VICKCKERLKKHIEESELEGNEERIEWGNGDGIKAYPNKQIQMTCRRS